MTSLDVRDMLNLPSAAGPRPAKKLKISGARTNLKGLQREVQSLGGDNPIAIVPEVPQFKKRRIANRKPAARWDLTPFKNSARKDGLILQHWRRKLENPAVPVPEPAEGMQAVVQEPEIEDSPFAKFNVQVHLPTFTDAQYEEKLSDEDWTKEETKYLLEMAQEFDLRWPVIWDRYEYLAQPLAEEPTEGENSALVPEPKVRSLEDLKARYYFVAATIMAILRPVQQMSQAEFSLHQLMSNFNAQQERVRKQFAENAMARSPEERREEESLLLELKRIMARSEKLNEERKELYARLEAPPSTGNVGIYTSSQGLQQLLHQLMNADKTKKRKSLMGQEGLSPAVGPSGQQSAGLDRRENGPRDSIGVTSVNSKKGGQGSADRRKLTPEEEITYGVSHHDRLTGGPSFRHERVTKQLMNRSAVQATKITNVLNELEIPPRLIMPTSSVVAEYEKLLTSINVMLDVKKLADKLDGEIKLAEVQKAEKEKRERRERGEPEPETQEETQEEPIPDADGDADMADADLQAEDEQDGQDEEDDGDGEDDEEKEKSALPSTRASSTIHKRSASVLSQISDKSTKRQRK